MPFSHKKTEKLSSASLHGMVESNKQAQRAFMVLISTNLSIAPNDFKRSCTIREFTYIINDNDILQRTIYH